MTILKPFTISVDEKILSDLNARLENTRWPDEIVNSEWKYGVNLSYLKQLMDYWLRTYDWRQHEKKLNAFPQFTAIVDGVQIHFVYMKGKTKKTFPLLITHGWPSSFVEMLKLVPLLTDPQAHGIDSEFSFDVIIPSLPGYGFSEKPKQSAWDMQKIADAWIVLMRNILGYQKFFAHGGDWGSTITSYLGFKYPEYLQGIHICSPRGLPQEIYPGMEPFSQEELENIQSKKKWIDTDAGYFHIQTTRPQTLAYGLSDSPAGLAAWIIEKWRDWSDCADDIDNRFTKDELLTNVMIYWITNTINSSMRLYFESNKNLWVLKPGKSVTVPCGVASFPGEGCLRSYAERFYNIQHWNEFMSGGHFPASEEPNILAKDIFEFVREVI